MSTQTQRERFEAWHVEHVSRRPKLDTPSGTWEDDKRAWAAWQAGQADMIERCAQRCERRYMGDNTREDMEAKRCAADIRALLNDGEKS